MGGRFASVGPIDGHERDAVGFDRRL